MTGWYFYEQRNYTHVKELLPAIQEMVVAGKKRREIAEHYGFKDKEVVKYLDVLVDGQYNDDLHSPILKWKGSSNQRVIDIKKTLKKDKIVLVDETKDLQGV